MNIADKVFGGTTDNGQNIVNAIGLAFSLPSPYPLTGNKKAFLLQKFTMLLLGVKSWLNTNKSPKETCKLGSYFNFQITS